MLLEEQADMLLEEQQDMRATLGFAPTADKRIKSRFGVWGIEFSKKIKK
jgi:hypothetical protein